MDRSSSPAAYRPNAAVIVTDGAGRVLLCRRAQSTYQTVQTVQGGIDPGETADQAARRELQEELGICDADYEWLGQAPGTFRYRWPEPYLATLARGKADYVGQEQTVFLAQVRPDTAFHLDAYHREFSEVWWGAPHELLEQAWEGKRPALETALRHFGLI